METDAQSKLKHWLASGQARLLPLTFPQREVWETSPVPAQDATNNICSAIDIRGPLTPEICREALQLVVAHQEVMRTSFLPGKERPVQLVRLDGGEPAMVYRELSPAESTAEGLAEAMSNSFSQAFDLLSGPLYRVEMLRLGPDHHTVALAIHHAVADGWTFTTFVEDFAAASLVQSRARGRDPGRLQGGHDSLPPLAMTYSAWGAAERSLWNPLRIARAADYWRRRLAGSRLMFSDRGSAPDPPGTELARSKSTFPAREFATLKAVAREAGATLFSTLLAAFRVALFRWLGADDAVLGTPVAGRSKSAVRETMGYFSGIVPLRSRIDPSKRFTELLRAVHDETVEDFAHAMPFAELVAAVEVGSRRGRHSVFDIRFAVQNHPYPSLKIPGISADMHVRSAGTTGTSRFDMACEVNENAQELDVIWLYRSSVLTEAEIGEITRLFREVVGEVCRSPHERPNQANP
ncbi:MAG: condensation domain-containing protein [Chthoniobacterales bacterium]|jgi:hypothetical protein